MKIIKTNDTTNDANNTSLDTISQFLTVRDEMQKLYSTVETWRKALYFAHDADEENNKKIADALVKLSGPSNINTNDSDANDSDANDALSKDNAKKILGIQEGDSLSKGKIHLLSLLQKVEPDDIKKITKGKDLSPNHIRYKISDKKNDDVIDNDDYVKYGLSLHLFMSLDCSLLMFVLGKQIKIGTDGTDLNETLMNLNDDQDLNQTLMNLNDDPNQDHFTSRILQFFTYFNILKSTKTCGDLLLQNFLNSSNAEWTLVMINIIEKKLILTEDNEDFNTFCKEINALKKELDSKEYLLTIKILSISLVQNSQSSWSSFFYNTDKSNLLKLLCKDQGEEKVTPNRIESSINALKKITLYQSDDSLFSSKKLNLDSTLDTIKNALVERPTLFAAKTLLQDQVEETENTIQEIVKDVKYNWNDLAEDTQKTVNNVQKTVNNVQKTVNNLTEFDQNLINPNVDNNINSNGGIQKQDNQNVSNVNNVIFAQNLINPNVDNNINSNGGIQKQDKQNVSNTKFDQNLINPNVDNNINSNGGIHKQDKQNNSGKIVIFSVLAAIGLVAVGGAIYYNNYSSSSKQSEDQYDESLTDY